MAPLSYAPPVEDKVYEPFTRSGDAFPTRPEAAARAGDAELYLTRSGELFLPSSGLAEFSATAFLLERGGVVMAPSARWLKAP